MAEKEVAVVGKLTIKNLKCNPSKVQDLPEGENKLPMAVLFGKASDVKYSEDRDMGVMHAYFAGTFEGLNLVDKTTVISNKLTLPKSLSDAVEKAIKELQAKDEGGSIAFAFELIAVKATNQVGYVYEAIALRKPEATDELGELRSFILTTRKNRGPEVVKKSA